MKKNIKQEFNSQVFDYGIKLINPFNIWKTTYGAGIKVGLLDSGIDYKHSNLNKNFVKGVNFTSNDKDDYMDYNGHGTMSAGVISSYNDIGSVGIAPNINLYNLKVLDKNAKGNIDNIKKGLLWCIRNNIKIIVMNFGLNNSDNSLHRIIKKAYTKQLIMVAPTGNEGKESTCNYPAQYKEVISVTAINKNYEIPSFATIDNAEISAPGTNITTTYLDNKFISASGTSLASSYIAGIIALLQGENLENNKRFLNQNQIRKKLFKHCSKIKNFDIKYFSFDN
jgi:subtilisin family serine protease